MFKNLKRTHKLAIIIFGLVCLWMVSGALFNDKEASEDKKGFNQLTSDSNAKVRVRHLVAQTQKIEMALRGRTEAKRIVDVKAEMGGLIAATPVERGQRVKKGAVLCQLSEEAYGALLAQAKANFEKASIDYEGAQKLKEKNLLSVSNVYATKAALENARANLKIAQINHEHLSMRAPFSGFVEDRPAQVGSLIERGGVCARLIDESKVLATGQVSEREVASLKEGLPVTAQLASGDFVKGKISFVGRTAHPQTRTYRVEATLEANGSQVRDGSTTQVTVPLEEVMAYQVSPGILTLDDAGHVGVRIVNSQSRVEFHPVQVVRETPDGVWITGLPPEIDLITVGQEFVADGDKVETAPDSLEDEFTKPSVKTQIANPKPVEKSRS